MDQTANLSLEIKRLIKAPRDRVYAAWTDPVQLKQWFGPEKIQTRELTAETRVGGRFRWDLTNSEGEEMTLFGEYRELQHNRKIVFTWQWDDDEDWKNNVSIVTVELSDREGGTELRLVHEQLPSKASRDRHTQGWESVLDRLEEFFGNKIKTEEKK
jgi:glutathione S-transferase